MKSRARRHRDPGGSFGPPVAAKVRPISARLAELRCAAHSGLPLSPADSIALLDHVDALQSEMLSATTRARHENERLQGALDIARGEGF